MTDKNPITVLQNNSVSLALGFRTAEPYDSRNLISFDLSETSLGVLVPEGDWKRKKDEETREKRGFVISLKENSRE